jgi:hypothetical protein
MASHRTCTVAEHTARDRGQRRPQTIGKIRPEYTASTYSCHRRYMAPTIAGGRQRKQEKVIANRYSAHHMYRAGRSVLQKGILGFELFVRLKNSSSQPQNKGGKRTQRNLRFDVIW